MREKKKKGLTAQLGIEPRLLALSLNLGGYYIASIIPLDHCTFHADKVGAT